IFLFQGETEFSNTCLELLKGPPGGVGLSRKFRTRLPWSDASISVFADIDEGCVAALCATLIVFVPSDAAQAGRSTAQPTSNTR
ncbi:MAG: hypothetical protein LBM75_01090, partial [Myxococcales bacterium]|nr:hypothetical protein [Myxococcales bacterium]